MHSKKYEYRLEMNVRSPKNFNLKTKDDIISPKYFEELKS